MKYFYTEIHYFRRIEEEGEAEAFPIDRRVGLLVNTSIDMR
jgi:hypothetical protein